MGQSFDDVWQTLFKPASDLGELMMSAMQSRVLILLGLTIALVGMAGWSSQQRAKPAGHTAGADGDAAVLRLAAERFVAAADQADVAAITATYDPEFTCIRVADEGGFARLSREQMLGFFNRPAGQGAGAAHAIPTKETTIHHAEVIGDTGFVLLTRIKDLGKGWEPMFYTLVWRKRDGQWRLLREYVHQKSIPKRL
jgi:ketosteroid isomerase-like protein